MCMQLGGCLYRDTDGVALRIRKNKRILIGNRGEIKLVDFFPVFGCLQRKILIY